MHSTDDSAPSQHDHGLDARHGAGQGAAGRVRASGTAASGQELHLLQHGQGRRPRELSAKPNPCELTRNQ